MSEARSVNAILLDRVETELRRIARELHDETGQAFATIAVGLAQIVDSATLEEVRGIAERLRRIAENAGSEVSRLARGLYPSALMSLGLAAAVERHIRDYRDVHGISVTLRTQGLEGGSPVDDLAAITVFRTVQEALTNVAKHSGAREARVLLARTAGLIRAVIEDNGRGCDPADALRPGRESFGLLGIRERVTLLGGAFRFKTSDGHGTTLAIDIPTAANRRTSPSDGAWGAEQAWEIFEC